MSTISGISGSGNAWAAAGSQRSQHEAKMFAKVDSDGSGGVDTAELGKMLSNISEKSGASLGDNEELFAKMDGNGDGTLSSDELSQGMKSLLPPPSTMAFAQTRGSDGAAGEGKGPPGGPPPPGGPGGPRGASAADESSESSSTTTYDALDTNEDGEVSDMERLAGALKDLAKAEQSESSSSGFSSEVVKLAQNLYDKISGSSQGYASAGQVSVAA